MLCIKNNHLSIDILDPETDRQYLGTRYCSGGYIFQITDGQAGALMSGPTFPDSFNRFDGQGIPDAFNLAPLGAADGGKETFIIGTGLCDTEKNEVIDPVTWDREESDAQISMSCESRYKDYRFILRRTVSLAGRSVRSRTVITNKGGFLPVKWFPHPFYPQPAGDELCRLSIDTRMPENPGYDYCESGFIGRKQFPDREGFYQPLAIKSNGVLTVLQKHPLTGLTGFSTSYAPAFLPIWGNKNTFSIEPFYSNYIAPGWSVEWHVDYDF